MWSCDCSTWSYCCLPLPVARWQALWHLTLASVFLRFFNKYVETHRIHVRSEKSLTILYCLPAWGCWAISALTNLKAAVLSLKTDSLILKVLCNRTTAEEQTRNLYYENRMMLAAGSSLSYWKEDKWKEQRSRETINLIREGIEDWARINHSTSIIYRSERRDSDEG